ncbi:glutathione S-transferase family protein [Methylomonas fluvii]|uniref:Glutathione S-transferase family protein n=1 Tax=Methylomonas fluvii TaxID=1854564 RepID=A0ABR9DAD6_9GAMM|nr:glutathione S-transferase family protein [Methylomonas fluvii]MBD9360063.1 glutathione S-transferase family protein [Methylomonas fluvii]CAD6872849.1 putative glutathione S-transferase [Methylomonas fluvii]
MITLYQFPRAWNIPNPGQFCVKLETYLRMTGIEYQIAETLPLYAPLGKLPFIEDNGYKLADSRMIIRYLQQQYGDSLDGDLSAEQNAMALAWQRLSEEHLYWVCMYSRWQYGAENWQINKQAIFQGLPQPMADMVAAIYRLRIRGQLRGHGIGRLPAAEIFELGRRDVAALSAALHGKMFLLGNQPSSVDASTYGILINLLACPVSSPVKDYALSQVALVDYCRRIQSRYFPELGEPRFGE